MEYLVTRKLFDGHIPHNEIFGNCSFTLSKSLEMSTTIFLDERSRPEGINRDLFNLNHLEK